MATVVDLVGQLRTAAAACQLRGLYATAKWYAHTSKEGAHISCAKNQGQ